MRTLIALLCGTLLLPLTGCTPSTAGGVRALGPERQVSFLAPENYQVVYRKVLDQYRKCGQGSGIMSQMVVQGDLYLDTKTGTITSEMHSVRGVNTFAVVDVAPIDERQTRVIGYYAIGRVALQGQLLREWVLEGSKECRLK